MATESATEVAGDISYTVDAEGTIIAVGGPWDETATANGGPAAMAERVVGTRLAGHIAGDATRMYLDSAIQSVRVLNRPRTLPYRCDSPVERRYMEMLLVPVPPGAVRVVHRLVRAERKPKREEVERRPQILRTCSMCLRDTLSGDWQDVPDAEARVAAHVYAICPDCDALARAST